MYAEPLGQVDIVTVATVVLGAVLLCSVLIIPLGLPGTWAMVAAAIAYALLVPHAGVGVITIGGVAAIALLAELLELGLVAGVTRRYGGSRRAAWGAIVGGFAGVIVGVPVPIVGPMLGGLIGAFVGALIAEFEAAGDHRTATRAAIGAVVARIASAAMKVGVGMAIAVWIMLAAISGA